MQISSYPGASRLALGTAQFGLPYGVANTQGQVSFEEASAMLGLARTAGIDTLDTAIAYGEAESVLGRIGVADFRVISKLPALTESMGGVDDWVVAQVKASLDRLCVPRLGALMLHAPDDLLGPYGSDLARGLLRTRDAGLADRIGLSVYSPEQLAKLVNFFPIEIVQIPFNIFDRRFFETGWLDDMAAGGIEVHIRSAFLQGLLLMPPNLVPSKFASYRSLINSWHTWLNSEASAGRSPLQVCLAHVASYASVKRIVIGADSSAQLKDIISAASMPPQLAPADLASPATSLINPAQWNNL